MSNRLLAEKIIKKARTLGAGEAEVFLENTREFELSVRNGEVENIKQSTSKGLGLTLFNNQRLGFSYTSDFSPESMDDFVKKAVQLSEVADPKPWNGLPDFEPGQLKKLDLFDPAISHIPSDKKIAMAREVETLALKMDKRITKSEGGYFGDSERDILVVNSRGVSRSMKLSGNYVYVGVVAGEGNDMQSGYWGSSKRHFDDLDKLPDIAGMAVKRAVDMLGAQPVTTQRVPVIFDRYMAGRFWYGILRAIYGDSVYKKTTFLTDFLDKPIASDRVTIVDDPTIPRHIASTPFDGEGKLTRKNILVDKGILKTFIYDTITARKAGVDVNTMTRRYGYQSPPYASFLNVVVQNGAASRDRLIAGVKNGFYVTGIRGTGTDVPTGNFSTGASGFWIKDGEIAFPVDGVTLGGQALDILSGIEEVADDIDMRGSLNSPSLKVAEITVGGKK